MAVALTLLPLPGPTAAQTTGAWLEAGVGEARWSTAASEAGRLRYGTLGVRGVWDPAGPFGFHAHLAGGSGADAIGGAGWLSGETGFWLAHRAGRFAFRAATEAWGIGYDQDLRYTAGGVRLAPSLEWLRAGWMVRARAEGMAGRWRLDAASRPAAPFPVPVPTPEAERGDLTLVGGGLDVAHTHGPLWVRVSPTAYRASGRVADAWQGSVEGESGLVVGPVTVAAGARWLSLVPVGASTRTETVSLLARATVTLGSSWALLAQYDDRAWDPVHAVQRGATAHIGVEWRWLPVRRRGPSVVHLGPRSGDRRAVTFRFRHPRAERVELMGDFTEWRPVAMTRHRDVWQATVSLPTGTHQFAFLVDGETWMVPENAPGIVNDGWNRRNGTLVIPEPF